GTEHLLLGLLHEEEGAAARALVALGVSLERARDEVVDLIGVGGSAPSGHVPFTPRAKKGLELALREAIQFGHDYIGTEHVLLGLIREGEGAAAQVLAKLGAGLSAVRRQVVELVDQEPPPTFGTRSPNVGLELGIMRVFKYPETPEAR